MSDEFILVGFPLIPLRLCLGFRTDDNSIFAEQAQVASIN